MEGDIRRGRHFHKPAGERMILADLLERYEAEILPRKAPTSIVTERGRLRWWNTEIGDRLLRDIDASLIEQCKSRLVHRGSLVARVRRQQGVTSSTLVRQGPLSDTTVKKYLRTLGHVFSVAVRKWKLIESNPVQQVEMPKEPKGRARFLSEAEMRKLLAACRESRCEMLYPAVLLSLTTGMRLGELRSLTWDRVDLDRGHVILEITKNKDTRGVPVTGEALAQLRQLARVRRLDTKFVFPSQDGRRGFDFRASFTKALQVAEITDFHWHDLRHTCASYLVMSGVALNTVASLLGHRTLAMTKRYSHLSDEFLRAEVEKMTSRVLGTTGRN